MSANRAGGSALGLMRSLGSARRGVGPTLAPIASGTATNTSFSASATHTPITTPLTTPRSSTLAPIGAGTAPNSANRSTLGYTATGKGIGSAGVSTPVSFSTPTSLSNTPSRPNFHQAGESGAIPPPPMVAGTTRQVNLGVLRPKFTSIYSERILSEREIEATKKASLELTQPVENIGVSSVDKKSVDEDKVPLPVQGKDEVITRTIVRIADVQPSAQQVPASISQNRQPTLQSEIVKETTQKPTVEVNTPTSEYDAQQLFEEYALAEAARSEFDVTVLNEDHLKNISGYEDLHLVTSLEIALDTTRVTNCDLIGQEMKALEELKFTSSYSRIPSWRDLGTRLSALRVLWISKCSLTDLSGIHFSLNLEELYLSYNYVSSLEPLAALSSLAICDAEGNCVEDLKELDTLINMSSLVNLSLVGNPIAVSLAMAGGSERISVDSSLDQIDPTSQLSTSGTLAKAVSEVTKKLLTARHFPPNLYRQAIVRRRPSLQILDDEEVTAEDRLIGQQDEVELSPDDDTLVESLQEAFLSVEIQAVDAVRLAKEHTLHVTHSAPSGSSPSDSAAGGGGSPRPGTASSGGRPQSAVKAIRQPASLAMAHQSLQSQAIDARMRKATAIETKNPTGVSGPTLFVDPFSQEFSLVYQSIRQNAYDPLLAALSQQGSSESNQYNAVLSKEVGCALGTNTRAGLGSAQAGARRRVISAPTTNVLDPVAVAAGARMGPNGQLVFNNPRQRVPPRSASDAIGVGSSPGRATHETNTTVGDGAGASALTQVSSVFRGSLTRSLRSSRPQANSSITTPLSQSGSVTSFTSTSARHTPPPPPLPLAPQPQHKIPAAPLSPTSIRDNTLKPSPPRPKQGGLDVAQGNSEKERSPRGDHYSQSPPVSPTGADRAPKITEKGPREIDEILADTDGMALVGELYGDGAGSSPAEQTNENGGKLATNDAITDADERCFNSVATKAMSSSGTGNQNFKRPMTASLTNARPTTASGRPQDSDLIRRAMMLLGEVKSSNEARHKDSSENQKINDNDTVKGHQTTSAAAATSPTQREKRQKAQLDAEVGIYNDNDEDDDADLFGTDSEDENFGAKTAAKMLTPEELERRLLEEGFLGGGPDEANNAHEGANIFSTDEDLMLEVRRLKARTARAVAEESSRQQALQVLGGNVSNGKLGKNVYDPVNFIGGYARLDGSTCDVKDLSAKRADLADLLQSLSLVDLWV